jgi:hypothetical protein
MTQIQRFIISSRDRARRFVELNADIKKDVILDMKYVNGIYQFTVRVRLYVEDGQVVKFV